MKKNQSKDVQIRRIETLDLKDLTDIVGGPVDGESTEGGSGHVGG